MSPRTPIEEISYDYPALYPFIKGGQADLQADLEKMAEALLSWRNRYYSLQAIVGDHHCPGFGERAVIDENHLNRQRYFSLNTFGPGARTKGVLDHIRKELIEVEEDPTGMEWVDVIILAFDGALRAGHEPQDILDAIIAKQATNEARKWPDWRTRSEDEAIEHDRSAE